MAYDAPDEWADYLNRANAKQTLCNAKPTG